MSLAKLNEKDIEHLNMITDGAIVPKDESIRSPYIRNDLYRKKLPSSKVGSSVGLGFD
jgi:hypothetical protein